MKLRRSKRSGKYIRDRIKEERKRKKHKTKEGGEQTALISNHNNPKEIEGKLPGGEILGSRGGIPYNHARAFANLF